IAVIYQIINFIKFIIALKETLADTRVWQWNDSLAALHRDNPVLASSRGTVSRARWTSYAAHSTFLPQFWASASALRRASEGVETDSYSLGISGSLSLFEGFAGVRTLALRKTDLSIAEIKYRRDVSDAVYGMRSAFVGLLWAQEQLSLSREILERRAKNSELVRLKYEAGREDKGSYLRVEADRGQAEIEVRRAERYLATAARSFLTQLGLDASAAKKPQTVGGFTLDIYDPNPAAPDFAALASSTPEYLESKKRLDAARLERGISHSRFWPDVSAAVSVGRSGEAFPPEDEARSASVNLSWRFFSGGADLFNTLAARDNVLVREADFKAAFLDAALSLESAWSDYIDAMESVVVREKYLDASRSQSEIVSARYLNGLVTYQEWYQVENDFINSKKFYLLAKREAGLKEAYWKKALGLAE
ncbi:MAG: TolC family protein, partial [Endomicrobiia bacterium]|nr:TolC family protein [Endomicrobiia bacterium]